MLLQAIHANLQCHIYINTQHTHTHVMIAFELDDSNKSSANTLGGVLATPYVCSIRCCLNDNECTCELC